MYFTTRPRPVGENILEITDLQGPGILTEPASFFVRAGEILGIFGLVGAGRSELLKLIYGATRTSSGRIAVRGQPVRIHSPTDAIAAGIVLCPEDRKKEGIIPIRSVMENLNLSSRRHFSTLGFIIRAARERANASKYVQRLGVKTPSLSR